MDSFGAHNFFQKLQRFPLESGLCVCVQQFLNGCGCVPNDFPYHSQAQGHMLCLSFKNLFWSPKLATRVFLSQIRRIFIFLLSPKPCTPFLMAIGSRICLEESSSLKIPYLFHQKRIFQNSKLPLWCLDLLLEYLYVVD